MSSLCLRRAAALVASVTTLVGGVTAISCAPRTVNVSSGAEPAAAGLAFTNHLRTAVNVYVRGLNGNEIFVRQVPAGGTESLVVRGVSPGSVVALRAAPIDGGAGYTRDAVTLGNGASWTVP